MTRKYKLRKNLNCWNKNCTIDNKNRIEIGFSLTALFIHVYLGKKCESIIFLIVDSIGWVGCCRRSTDEDRPGLEFFLPPAEMVQSQAASEIITFHL